MELSCALGPRDGLNGCVAFGGVLDGFPIADGIAKDLRIVEWEKDAVVSADFSMNRNIADKRLGTVPKRLDDG